VRVQNTLKKTKFEQDIVMFDRLGLIVMTLGGMKLTIDTHLLKITVQLFIKSEQ